MLTALVLLSAILNASWNAFVKNDDDRALAMAWIMGLGGVASACVVPFIAWPRPEVWPYLLATTIFQNLYLVLVLLSYKHGDLSQAYPIARGTAALTAALVSAWLGIDRLVPREWAGIALSSAGIASLALAATGSARALRRAVGYPLLSGLATAGYSIVDGSGVRIAPNAFEYVVWMNLCASPFLPAYVAATRGQDLAKLARARFWPRAAAAAVALSSYSIAVWAFSQHSIGRTAVLRETSVLFAAILGSLVLKEPFGFRRILSAIVILLGFALWP